MGVLQTKRFSVIMMNILRRIKMSFLSECSSGGCGAKIGVGQLAALLSGMEVKRDANLLVGFDKRDDACVYELANSGGQCLVSTVDFFSPMVEDPFVFGQIAAANALSDIYAMGAFPLYALNLVCFPERYEKSVLAEMLKGGAQKALEADTIIAGGHSIYDHEPKYGLSVTGLVNKNRLLKNDNVQLGDNLILTKALGVGLIMSAFRENAAEQKHVDSAIASMTRLNKYAALHIKELQDKFNVGKLPVHACTDVTGFGLAVHASEMANENFTVVIDSKEIPVLDGALEYARVFVTSGGKRNRNYIEQKINCANLSEAQKEIIFDPETSGGLLIAVSKEYSKELLACIQKDDAASRIIGTVEKRNQYCVEFK
jgi:selenide,water dikinase